MTKLWCHIQWLLKVFENSSKLRKYLLLSYSNLTAEPKRKMESKNSIGRCYVVVPPILLPTDKALGYWQFLFSITISQWDGKKKNQNFTFISLQKLKHSIVLFSILPDQCSSWSSINSLYFTVAYILHSNWETDLENREYHKNHAAYSVLHKS